MPTAEQNLAIADYHRQLYAARRQLWESVPPGQLNVELYVGLAKAAKLVVAGQVGLETVQSNLRRMTAG